MDKNYACLMLDFEMPKLIKELQKKIKIDDIFLAEDANYGLEKECHVTIVFGLENDVTVSDLKKHLSPLKDYRALLTSITKFENEEYDVLKVDVKCPKAEESNKLIRDNFKTHNKFKDYHAHMTIAYLKKGKGDEYVKKLLDKFESFTPTTFSYSWYEDDNDPYSRKKEYFKI